LDENYQIYLNRILRNTLPETYKAQVQHIQPSPKFQRQGDRWEPVSFPGYTVITPPGQTDAKNAEFYSSMASYTEQITAKLGSDLFIPVAPSSFHLTLADVIWDSAYLHAHKDPEFDGRLQQQIKQSFQQCQAFSIGTPIRFQAIGLMVMTRAVAVALAATDEMGYHNILNLRRSIYQNAGLMQLGVEQQYYFTPHVTLGYFGDLAGVDRDALSHQLDDLNQPWIGTAQQEFWVHQAELRKFSNMTTYDREADWPTFQF
jgi:2'-5' RNA ligase